MKTKTVKILSGVCVVVICLAPVLASEFNYVSEKESNIKIENIKEGSSFYFVPAGAIGIKGR